MVYYSKWIEIIQLKNITANHIVQLLKGIFVADGVPQIIVCDNVPFESFEFKTFANNNNIEMRYSSPHYPRSNELAERTVQTVKMMFEKLDKSSLENVLLE